MEANSALTLVLDDIYASTDEEEEGMEQADEEEDEEEEEDTEDIQGTPAATDT